MAVLGHGHIGRRAGLRYFGYINALHRCRERNKKKVRDREGAGAARSYVEGRGSEQSRVRPLCGGDPRPKVVRESGGAMLVGDEDPD